MKLSLFLACILLIPGCSNPSPSEVSRVSLGKVIDANVLNTSFNEHMKMQIKTEKAIVVIYRLPKVDLGEEAFYVEMSNGRRYFTWSSANQLYLCQ